MILLTVCIATMLSACGSSSPVVGTWKRIEGMTTYGNILILKKDGTGSADGIPFNWIAKDRQLSLAVWTRTIELSYKTEGGTLIIREISNENNLEDRVAKYEKQ